MEWSGLVSLQVELSVKLVVSDDGGRRVRTTTSTPDVGHRRQAHEAAAHVQEALKTDASRALICGSEIHFGSSTASSPSPLAPRVWHSPMSAQVWNNGNSGTMRISRDVHEELVGHAEEHKPSDLWSVDTHYGTANL